MGAHAETEALCAFKNKNCADLRTYVVKMLRVEITGFFKKKNFSFTRIFVKKVIAFCLYFQKNELEEFAALLISF